MSSSNNSQSSAVSWIAWCCSLPGHDWFLQVPESFIEDDFNLISITSDNYSLALDMILDLESDEIKDVESEAITLYGLIHARFLTTRAGLAAYRSRFHKFEFGTCPRYGCHSSPLIPTGISDTPLKNSVKLYCPRCLDIYTPKQSKYSSTDGAAFGTTFAALFFTVYPDLIPSLSPQDTTQGTISKYGIYVPKIFGFKVSIYSPAGPVMRWLRRRIVDVEEMVLDTDSSSEGSLSE